MVAIGWIPDPPTPGFGNPAIFDNKEFWYVTPEYEYQGNPPSFNIGLDVLSLSAVLSNLAPGKYKMGLVGRSVGIGVLSPWKNSFKENTTTTILVGPSGS